jgi:hypothetical protein
MLLLALFSRQIVSARASSTTVTSYLISLCDTPRWSWTRLLKRVFAFDMAHCPACGRGRLRIIAAITQAAVIRKILRHGKLATDPPPIAPARACQDRFAWTSP